MKKISLFLFFLLFSLSSSAQLALESFETWVPGQGPANWKILQNTIGTSTQWAQTNAANTSTPPYTGLHAAYLSPQNVSSGMPEDYLVTPLFNSPVNGRIEFYSRLTMPLDQGAVYKVKILPAGADADDITNYVELQSWTELEINPQQLIYTKVTVAIPQIYDNTNVRVAFVILSDDADRWLIDDVKVVSECVIPENLLASDITQTSANLTWDNPGNAPQFQVEFLEDSEPPTGVGVPYNGTQPYAVSNLTPGLEYKFYVKALCTDGGESEWAGPFRFLTQKPGDNCQNPKLVTALPFTNTDDTANYFDLVNGPAGGCGVPASQGFLNGNDIFYAYTATQTGTISINVSNITETYTGVFVYTACADVGTACYAGAANDFMTPAPDLTIPSISVTAGTTYYIVISSWFAQTTGFTITIQQEFCDRPANLTATAPTNNGITLGWESTDTAWQYVVQPLGTGIPMGAGQPVTVNPLNLNNLTPSTQYEFYVRANCTDGTFSSWAGPLVFNTLCTAFTVPYSEGFNSGSESQFCWNIADSNNDGSVWDMDFTYDSYEGDQSAKFDVSATTENDDMLISPAILLTGNERLKFHYKSQDSGAAAFKVVASVTGTDPQDFTIELSPLTSYATSEWTEKIINVANLPAGPVYFAWYVPAGYNGGYELMIDNIIVEALPACAEPTDIVINSISETGASIAWTPGNNEAAWEILAGEASAIGTPGINTPGTPTANPAFDASALLANTQQAVYVRAVCGPAGKSVWSGPYYFTTKCTPFPIPFTEGFNSDSATETCWTVVNGNGDWAEWTLSETPAFEGDEAAKLYTGNAQNNEWLISPALVLTGNERLKFHYRIGSADEGTTGFRVMLSTGSTDIADFTQVLVPETTYTNEDFVVKTVSLAAYSGTVYMAWHVPPTVEFGSDLMIDNVVVEPMPVCPEPQHIEVSAVTSSSAQVTWTPGNNETQWELFANVSGAPVPATGIIVNTLPYTLTALPDGTPITSGTLYEVAVKAVCSSTESSIMSDKAQFVTLITNDECAAPVTVPVNNGPSCDVYASGTLNGATTSTPQDSPCGEWVSVNEDVWFEFTATTATHTVTFFDITQGTPHLTFIVYKGDDCGNLETINACSTASFEYNSSVLLEGLEAGAKYKIRIFNSDSTPVTTNFKVCIKVPVAPVTVSTTQYTVEQLVTDVLFEGNCTQISNVTWSTGTNYPDPDNIFGDNPNGIAYFNQGDSGFPFAEGIVMTTGDVAKVPGPNYRAMEQGSAVWLGDTDIDAVMEGFLGAPPFQPSTNASVIEFDFVPSLPTLSLDFMFASEEYGDLIQCYSYDTFAILLTGPDGTTQNIAVIPGTSIPISVFNISGAGYTDYCPGYNLPWFGQYNVFGQEDYSPTSFAGQTVVMTATANLQVDQPYHIKIAIAETDNNLDSGVFIKAGVNVGAGTVDLGADMLVSTGNAVCFEQTATIETGLDAAAFDFVWKKDDVVIPGETSATLVVSEPGEYTVSANVTGYNCLREDSVIVEFYPSIEDATANPTDLTVCEADGFAEFDLESNTAVILQGLNPADYTITYHATAQGAADTTGVLVSPYTNTVQFEQPVYVRIVNNTTQCYAVKTFTIRAQDLTPQFDITGDFAICTDAEGTITVTPINFDAADATFTWTLNGAAFAATGASVTVTEEGDYEVTVNTNGCTAAATVNVTILPALAVDTLQDITVCGSYTLLPLTNGNYFTGQNGTGEALSAGEVLTETKLVYIFAQSGDCSAETSFTVTINPAPQFTLEGDFITCRAEDATITVNALNFTAGEAAYVWTLDGNTISETGSSIQATIFGNYGVTVTWNGCEAGQGITIEQDTAAVDVAVLDGCENNIYGIEAADVNGSFNPDTALYAWTGPEGFTSDERGFAVPMPGVYAVTVTTIDGCVGEAEYIVTTTTCEIPKGISPNNDGFNDELDLSTFDVKKLVIFNRYGKEVYSRNNYTNEWKGQDADGKELPTGTYFYMIERGQGESKTGWIYINRQE